MPRNNKGEITAHYVDVDADNKRWVNVGKKPINREDVESVVEWNPGQYGITATVKLKDGTYQRVEVPKNLNPSALGDPYTGSIGYINQAFRSTDEINDILNHNANGEIPDMMDANGHVISYKKGNLSMEEEFQLRQKLASNENIIFAYTTKLGQMVKSEDIKVK